jgi:site-specific recombinase XerD
MTKISISFFPKSEKKSAKNGKTPVYVRVILNCKKAESRLNLDLDDKEVNLWNPMLMRVGLPKSISNDHLNTIETEFKKFISVNANELTAYRPAQILDKVLKRKNNDQNLITVLEYIEQYYNNSVFNRGSIEIGTKKNYLKAIKHFKAYIRLEGIPTITFKEFEFKHANNFKNYLLNNNEAINKKGMTEESALGIVKKFRTIFDQAIEENMIEKNYFKKIKFNCKPTEKPRFSIDHVNSLYNLNEGKISTHEELCRDLILFSTFTGLAFQDTTRLPKSFLEIKESEEVKLLRPRTKTTEYVEQFLTSNAVALIDKYKNHPKVSTSEFVFPDIDNSTYNKTLKIIALKAGINFNVTTHTGRHSFRQLLSEANIDDYAVIKRMMGQKNRDVIDAVYYKITETRLIEAKRKFEVYLCENLSHDLQGRDIK